MDNKLRTSTEGLNVKEEHLIYLKKMIDTVKDKSEDSYLLLTEKLIYLVLDYLNTRQTSQLPYDVSDEAAQYLDIMNRKAVESFNETKMEDAGKHIGRIIELLNHKNLPLIYHDQNKLYEVKILSYNNLSCIYRKLGKLA